MAGVSNDVRHHIPGRNGRQDSDCGNDHGAEKKRPWEVFVAAAVALAAVSAIGVFVGTVLGQYVPIEWIKRTAGAAFIVIGILVLFGNF